MPGTKTLWVSTPHHNQYWKLHWLWLLTDLSGNNRTLDYWVSLSSEWSDKACCHKPGTRNTLLRNLAKKNKKKFKKPKPQFHSTGENNFFQLVKTFLKKWLCSNSGTLFQEKISNVRMSQKLPVSQKSCFLVILQLCLPALNQSAKCTTLLSPKKMHKKTHISLFP